MIFEIRHVRKFGGAEWWEWEATSKGEAVCQGTDQFFSEQETRSDIAKARKAMGGARFAKVVVKGQDEPAT